MPVTSNWFMITTIIGASAMIGIVCEAMIQGMRLRSRLAACTIITASSMPSTEPTAKPRSVASSVTRP